ncbi:MAG: DUF2161 family putative PD-(D/E)XK-type phosphodiesterase [Bacillota bacterium]
MAEAYKEKDLFPPIHDFFVSQGYAVDGEVKKCDLVAQKEDHMIVVELKLKFQLQLVYQAIDRQKLTEDVYVALPRPESGQNTKAWKNMLRLLKRLSLGLITVAMDSPVHTVEVVLEPKKSGARKSSRHRNQVEKEFSERNFRSNIGGSSHEKVLTAYRERSIELLCIFAVGGAKSLKELRAIGKENEYASVLRGNAYDWFQKVDRAVFTLSDTGKDAFHTLPHREVVDHYVKKYEEIFRGCEDV